MRDHLKLVSATSSPRVTATFELKVVRALCNRLDNMHGGAIGLVYDMCTTMAMAPASRSDFWFFGGVSRTLSVTFLRPPKIGMDVLVECELLQIGSRLGKSFCRRCYLVVGIFVLMDCIILQQRYRERWYRRKRANCSV